MFMKTGNPDIVGVETARLEAVLARLTRFSLVGLASTALYAATALSLQGASAPPLAASLWAYAASTAFSFAGHKWFTFNSHGRTSTEGARFAISSLVGLNVVIAAPVVSEAVGAPGWTSVLASCALTPAINYVLLNAFVFARR